MATSKVTSDPIPADEVATEESVRRSTYEKLKRLPTPVGIVLMSVGVVGLVLPGPIGTPFILAGGLVLAPKMFGKLNDLVERSFPDFHHTGMHAVERFIADLEKRYPSEDR